MAYTQFDQTAPNPSVSTIATVCAQVIANQKALRDMVSSGALFGWAGSVTTAGTDNFHPAVITLTKGVERIRKTYSYSAGNCVGVFYEYSSNSGSTYDPIGTMTLSLNGDGSYNSHGWS